MVEFSEDLSEIYTGVAAIKQRVTTRVLHTTSDIPYYERGVDLFEFTYGSKDAAIRLGLRDFGAVVKYDDQNSRVQIYDIEIDITDILDEGE